MKAYTLIEIVIVMAIIALISGLSIVGIIRYKSSVEINATYTDIIASLKTQRNKAVNSVSYNPDPENIVGFNSPAFYALVFLNNKYEYYFCEEVGINNLVNCAKEENTSIIPPANEIVISSTCQGIGFKHLTGDIVKLNLQSNGSGNFETTPSPGKCIINITHSQVDISRDIPVDVTYDKL